MVRQAADAYVDISIHTPARGVTYAREYAACGNVFQSTLPQGE